MLINGFRELKNFLRHRQKYNDKRTEIKAQQLISDLFYRHSLLAPCFQQPQDFMQN